MHRAIFAAKKTMKKNSSSHGTGSTLATDQGIVFIDLRLDYAFHLVFGTPGNEDLLLRLINAILPHRNITSVELSTQEHVGLRPDSRKAVFDVFCTTSDGSHLTIEMQFGEQKDFNERMLFYSTFPVQNDIRKGRFGEYGYMSYSFQPVCVIGITDFILKGVPENKDMINYYSVRNDKAPERLFSENVSFVTVELPKLGKGLSELRSDGDFIFYAIRNIHSWKEIPEEFAGHGLEKLFELCSFAKMSKQHQMEYLAEFMARLDEQSRLRTAWENGEEKGIEKGIERGKAEGKAEGKEEERLANARKFKALGVAEEIICQATGLSAEEVAAL